MTDRNEKEELTRRISAHVTKLPPIPQNVDRLLQEATRPNRNDDNLTSIIKSDPGLCSELLHLATCCASGQKPPETVDEAIEQVDLTHLVDLVGASYVNNMIQREYRDVQRLDDYFAHSREIAATCPILAETLGLSPRQQYFFETVGVLHDIGRLVMRLATSDTTIQLMGTPPTEMADITDREKAVLGLNHCEVGEQICRRWRFTPALQEAVARHHTPLLDKTDFCFSGALIFLAHFVAGSDFTGDILSQVIPETLFAKMGLTPALFDEACARYHNKYCGT